MRIIRHIPDIDSLIILSTDSFFIFNFRDKSWTVTLNPKEFSYIHFLDYSGGKLGISQTRTDNFIIRDLHQFLLERVNSTDRGLITHRETHRYHRNGAIFIGDGRLLVS